MSSEMAFGFVGRSGTETVEGTLSEDGKRFTGKGVAVKPSKGLLSLTEKYDLSQSEDGVLLDLVGGSELRRTPVRPSLPLIGSLPAVAIDFAQAQLAKEQGVELAGMLGQLPLHVDYALEVDHTAGRVNIYEAGAGQAAAQARGHLRLPGVDLNRGLFGVGMTCPDVLPAPGAAADGAVTDGALLRAAVPAIVDSGAANTILNWEAAYGLLGIRPDDPILRGAPRIQAMGIGGGLVEMPLLAVSLGLVAYDAESGAEATHVPSQPSASFASPVSIHPQQTSAAECAEAAAFRMSRLWQGAAGDGVPTNFPLRTARSPAHWRLGDCRQRLGPCTLGRAVQKQNDKTKHKEMTSTTIHQK